jgi:carbonic anhydrase
MELIKINRKGEKFTIFYDPQDYEIVNAHTWSIAKNGNTYYAITKVNNMTTSLHALIMGRRHGYIIDHKDKNGLNCMRENLRFCTKSQNAANRCPSGKSKYLGVIPVYIKKYVKTESGERAQVKYLTYQVNIVSNGTRISTARNTEKEAALLYNKLALRLHGEFARLNVIEE